MKIYRLLLSCMIMCTWLCLEAQTYINPVISGFHPDPSVCRVGHDFYAVNSSFNYFPGVPIFPQQRLGAMGANRQRARPGVAAPLKEANSWLGIYVPTIRYHQGTYYVITTNVGNGGNFMATSANPRGPWSESIWLEQ